MKYEYVFHWRNTEERKRLFGRRCRIVTMGKQLKTVLIEFEDGEKIVVSQRALRRADKDQLELPPA